MKYSRSKLFCLLAIAAAASAVKATEPVTGPVIMDYGPVFEIPEPKHLGDPQEGLRAVFDVGRSPEDPAKLNPSIETVARFLNLHIRAGFPRDRLRAVLVLHGRAGEDALAEAAYRRRHGTNNPNLELLEALRDAGVEIYLCGQSASFRGLRREEITSSVRMASSAMTVLLQAQADGYGLIAF